MKFKAFLLAALLIVAPSAVFAGSACATPTIVPADGRVVDFDFVAPSSSNFYQFSVTAGNSYSVEVRQDYDDVNTDITVTAFSDGGTCATALAGTTSTSASEPQLPANATRFSFTAAATGLVAIKVTNGNASTGRYDSVSVSDTTQYNVRWSTAGGFLTQWGFFNTTSQVINVKLIVTENSGGSAVHNLSFQVPAHSQVLKSIGLGGFNDINGITNKTGFMVATSDAPPGGLLTDAFFVVVGSPSVIVPSVFGPVRQGHSGR